MFKLFSEIEGEVSKFGDVLKGVFSKVHTTVSDASEFTKEELQAGVAEFLATLNGADFSISQAFEAGATYAATKLKAIVEPVVAEVQPEVQAAEAVGEAVAEVAPAVSEAVTAEAPKVASEITSAVGVASSSAAVVQAVVAAQAAYVAPVQAASPQ